MLHLIWTNITAPMVETIVFYMKATYDIQPSVEIVDYAAFANGETRVSLEQSVRGKSVFVLADVMSKADGSSLNDKYMHTKLLLQTAKNHGAVSVNLLMPAYPYARQDKPVHAWLKQRSQREPASTQLVAQELQQLGIDYCVTLDIHNPATAMAFTTTKFVDLYTWWFVQEALERMQKGWNAVLSGADQWWDKKISAIAKDLNLDYIISLKKRAIANEVNELHVYGDVEDKDILVHDDMLDTWWTLCRLLETMKWVWPRSINVAIAHGLCNGPAFERLQKVHDAWIFETLYITNSVYHAALPAYIEVIDISPLLANTIMAIYEWKSISYNAWN